LENFSLHTEFLIPKLLYGTIATVGRGWKSLARKIWKDGWSPALSNIEYVDALRNVGAVVLADKPDVRVFPEYRANPFYAMYGVHSALKHFAVDNGDDPTRMLRFRDLALEGLNLPWYALATIWPEGGFLPPYMDCFSTPEEWQQEERRVGFMALKRITGHFALFSLIEHRMTDYGGRQSAPVWKFGYKVMGVLQHCLKAGMPESELIKFRDMKQTEAESALFDWMKNSGLNAERLCQ